MVEKKHVHVRKYQSIGWRGAEVTIMESAIINNNYSYFVTRCTTSNLINPFAPGDFAEKRVLKLVEWFSGHCRAIKS